MTNINLNGLDAAIKPVVAGAAVLKQKRDNLAKLNPHLNKEVEHEYPKILEERREKVASAAAVHLGELQRRFREKLEDFRAYIGQCATPCGQNLRSEDARGELYLLEHGLIDSPEELEAMRKRNLSAFNPAVLRAIDHYAADESRKWSGFEFAVDTASLWAACDVLEKLGSAFFADPEHSNIDAVLENASGKRFLQFVKWGDE